MRSKKIKRKKRVNAENKVKKKRGTRQSLTDSDREAEKTDSETDRTRLCGPMVHW